MLGETYDDVDHISLHAYYWEQDGDPASFLASAVDMDHFIESVVATADHVRAAPERAKKINISFDEWNVWYLHGAASRPTGSTTGRSHRALLEDDYSVADAVVVGSLLITLLRHSDRVQSACLAQLVNVIAPIMTEPGGRGVAADDSTRSRRQPDCQRATCCGCRSRAGAPYGKYGDVPALDAVATHDPETGALTVFAVNRLLTDDIAVTIGARGYGTLRLVGASQLSDPTRI